MKRLLQNLVFLVGVGVAFLVGLGIPIHFRALDTSVLERAGSETMTLADRALAFVDAGRPGPALVLREQLRVMGQAVPELDAALASVLEERPLTRLSGGDEPYFLQFLRGLGLSEVSGRDEPVAADTLGLMVSKDARRRLSDVLSGSSKATVQVLLASREIKGTMVFQPVFTPAGGPLETAILTMALLEQANFLQDGLSREVRGLSEAALDRNLEAVRELETIYLSLLVLAKRHNWVSLGTLMETIPTGESLRWTPSR